MPLRHFTARLWESTHFNRQKADSVPIVYSTRYSVGMHKGRAGCRLGVGTIVSVEDTEIKLALVITSALVRKDANKLLEAVIEFMELHDLTADPARVAQVPTAADRTSRQSRPSHT